VYDVIVVGGGPTGSRAAFRLAKMGYQVIVLEKRSDIGQKPCCTGIVSQECVTWFDIPREVILKNVNTTKIVSPSGRSIGLSSSQSPAAIVDRVALDHHLAGLTKAQGVQYYVRRKAEYISLRPEKVVVGIKDEGCDYQLEAKAVVLASGFNSVLVKDLGLGRPGDFAAGVQTEVELNGIDEIEVYFGRKIAPGFFTWLVPTAKGKGLAGLISRRTPGLFLREWLKKLASEQKIIRQDYTFKFGGIPLRPLSRTFTDRVLAVGDAAGQVKSTTGGGIYFGLLCADIAAETLHNAFQSGDLSAQKLSLYERNWRGKLGSELRREYFGRKMFERLSDRQIEKLFSVIQSSGLLDSLSQEEFSFDWHGSIIWKALKLGAKRLLRPNTG
jgi:digeranylgeranylglycerophospholipid reductase